MPPSLILPLIYPLQCIVSDVDFEFGEVAEIMTMRIDSVVYGNILNFKSSDSGSVLSASFLVGLLGIQFSASLADFIAAMHSRPHRCHFGVYRIRVRVPHFWNGYRKTFSFIAFAPNLVILENIAKTCSLCMPDSTAIARIKFNVGCVHASNSVRGFHGALAGEETGRDGRERCPHFGANDDNDEKEKRILQ